MYSFVGELEYESVADGQILVGSVIPAKKDYFITSTFNEETNASAVSIYRKQKLLFRVGGPYEEPVLDLKIVGSTLFIPKGLNNIDRIEIKGL